MGALPLLVALWACARPAALPEAPVQGRLTAEVDGLRAELVTEGSAVGRAMGGDEADLVLLYGAEEGGSLDPCGCDDRPRGGLARQAAYRDAVVAAAGDAPVLLVDAGGWLSAEASLDGSPRPDVPARNTWMLRGLDLLGPTALNVSAAELRALAELAAAPPPELAALAPPPLVSAHIQAPPDALWQVQPWRVVEVDGLRVGLTGVAAPGPAWMAPQGWRVQDPLPAARAVLRAHAGEVDVVVLLAHALPDAARTLAEEGLVDVVVDAWTHRSFTAPFRVGDAVWVRAHTQTMRLGEARLHLDAGRVSRAHVRMVDLDEGIAGDPALVALADQARHVLRQIERLTFGRGTR